MSLEATVGSLAKNSSRTYAGAVSQNVAELAKTSSDRISKLEYTSSEEERKRRVLQITIKHPELNSSAPELERYVRNFLEQKMKMETREIDANLSAVKAPRDNKIIVTLSHKRYKTFLFKSRKNLRQADEEATKDLFINDNLTTFNFGLLMQLKRERSRRLSENLPNFAVVYTFNGKVFIKIERGANNEDALNIKNASDLSSLVLKLDSPTTAAPI